MAPDPAATPDERFRSLHTPRLAIRRFEAGDAAALAAYRSDPEVARYQSWDTPYPLARAQELIAALIDTHPGVPGEWFQLAVVERDSGDLVGDLAVHTDGDDARLVQIGFTLSTAVQGRGYATEAVTALLDHLFTQRGTHRVAADCDTRNTASVMLLERVGMRREAHHLASAWFGGEWTDEYVYAVLASEWGRGR